MERYDHIEYGVQENTGNPSGDGTVHTTDKDGFITSQRFVSDNKENEVNNQVSGVSEESKTEKPKKEKNKDAPRENVLIFQLAVCILLAIAAFVIKSIGGELYNNVREFYYTNLNNSIIIEMDNDKNNQFMNGLINETESEKN